MEKPRKIYQLHDLFEEADKIDTELLWDAYSKDNIEFEYTPKNPENKKIAVVYFSSNGLYWRGKTNFQTRVIEQNRYEWKKNKLKNADLHIFVRDVWCRYYFYGINNQVDSIVKLAELIKEKTQGYAKVIMIGSSAGGYAATLIGSLNQADYVLSFSGQFDVEAFDKYCYEANGQAYKEDKYMLKGQELSERKQYLQIADYVKNADVPIYYFVGNYNQADVHDCQIAMSLPNVRVFRFNNKKHGMPIDKRCLTDLINMNKNDLEQIHALFRGRVVSWNEFGFRVSGLKYVFAVLRNWAKSLEVIFRNLRNKLEKL
ncbi:MAG: hypothetical protein IJX20_03430 [Alphaproteobacteria bacterium]|nr:hypothetical protein [Alphaproteobacteria bacterium]